MREDDYPINMVGAGFRESGSLLLGLRFPVAADGWPILIELDGIGRLFEPGDGLPECWASGLSMPWAAEVTSLGCVTSPS